MVSFQLDWRKEKMEMSKSLFVDLKGAERRSLRRGDGFSKKGAMLVAAKKIWFVGLSSLWRF